MCVWECVIHPLFVTFSGLYFYLYLLLYTFINILHFIFNAEKFMFPVITKKSQVAKSALHLKQSNTNDKSDKKQYGEFIYLLSLSFSAFNGGKKNVTEARSLMHVCQLWRAKGQNLTINNFKKGKIFEKKTKFTYKICLNNGTVSACRYGQKQKKLEKITTCLLAWKGQGVKNISFVRNGQF